MKKQPPELDPELRRLFIEESEQKASEISRGIAEFNNAETSGTQILDRMVWLQMRFAEYSGIANTLGLQRSGQACALVVDELTQVIAGARAPEDSLSALFDDAMLAIDDALEYLHGEDIDPERIFDTENDEPTVAEQLPELNFPEVNATQGRQRPSPLTGIPRETLTQEFPTAVDSSLLEVFMDEAEELVDLGESAWQNWQNGTQVADAIQELRRVFHTIKGGARLTQMLVLGDYVHAAENGMDDASNPQREADIMLRSREALDQLQSAVSQLKQGKTASFLALPGSVAKSAAPPPPANETTGFQAAPIEDEAPHARPSGRNFVRVRTNTLEALRLRASEVNALRNQIQQVSTALQTEQELTTQTIAEASTSLRHARFALERLIDKLPSSHSQMLTDAQLESQMALQAMEDVLLRLNRQNDRSTDLASHIERALHGQSKAGFALQENILNTRLVPFGDFRNRLRGIVRQAADSCPGKQVELEIEGEKTEVDRHLIEQLIPALEHMLRNCVAHGIEPETVRREIGKPPIGLIRIFVRKTRGKLELDLKDDGAGLALDKIQARAIEFGVIGANETLSQRSIERLIFHPGLSAADEVDQLAGRGVGMDVVEHTVHDLGGNIDLSSTPGAGTRFVLRLPMGETALDAVIVHIADELYAVPQSDIRSIQRLDDHTLSKGYQENTPIAWNGQGWDVQSLGYWLGLGEGRLPGPRRSLPALLVDTDQTSHAIVVDYCGESAEYSLEKLPPAVTGIVGVTSAVILEDGQIAPVLDLPALCQADVRHQRHNLRAAPPDPNQRYKVMVIDDSTTWLRQLTRGLSRYPMDVTSCKDGQEALLEIEKDSPQLLVVDLEMPRMDGLEFLRRLRRNPKFAHIPAVMFSTVTGSTQRNRARQLGAKAWVNKSANMRPLITEIDRQLGTEFARHETDETA